MGGMSGRHLRRRRSRDWHGRATDLVFESPALRHYSSTRGPPFLLAGGQRQSTWLFLRYIVRACVAAIAKSVTGMRSGLSHRVGGRVFHLEFRCQFVVFWEADSKKRSAARA